MPLDGHSYLVSQGWGGKGTGLRQGAISRPIAVAQKKNLAGLGKDRDEAFPFWDHLFSAAASAIKLSIDDPDDDTEDTEPKAEAMPGAASFKLTQTGILSNRRPATGTPADSSGSSTPDSQPADDGEGNPSPRYSLLAAAKRNAARRGLYSRFFKGPVLGPDTTVQKTAKESSPTPRYSSDEAVSMSVGAMMKQATSSSSIPIEDTVEKEHNSEDAIGSDSRKTERRLRKREREEKRKAKEERRRRKEKKSSDECAEMKEKNRKDKGAISANEPSDKKRKSRDRIKGDSILAIVQPDSKKSKKLKRQRSVPEGGDTATLPKKKRRRKHEHS